MIPRKIADISDRARRKLLRREHSRQLATLEEGSWSDFAGLLPTSVTLAGIRQSGIRDMHVNVLLPDFGAGSMFAGIRTALAAASALAVRMDASLRIITYGPPISPNDREFALGILQREMDLPPTRVEFLSGWTLAGTTFSHSDIWIATYWTTAHALDIGQRIGVIDPAKVVYLIQDYEAGFYAGSSESAIAKSTYHAGFIHIVNSRPLFEFLRTHEKLDISEQNVFRPELDLERLTDTAKSRGLPTPLRIGFYGRPSKPRNSFKLGVAAIKATARSLREQDRSVEFFSMGEPHAPIDLGAGQSLTSLGKLAWPDYFRMLSSTPITFSLQQSPHPSHIPLDSVASGGFAVTNDLEGSRVGLSPRLIAVESDPVSLRDGLLEALDLVGDSEPVTSLDEQFVERLGRPLDDVVASLTTTAR
jgi:hypothetical protein